MKYEVTARRIDDLFVSEKIIVREKGFGRFFIPKDERRVYKSRAQKLAKDYGNITYRPLHSIGLEEISIEKSRV